MARIKGSLFFVTPFCLRQDLDPSDLFRNLFSHETPGPEDEDDDQDDKGHDIFIGGRKESGGQ